MSKPIVSRRQFSTTAAAMTGVGIVGSANAALAEEVAWDGEYDVVVVGMGFAGCVSAISAADEGAKVLLVDKAPEGSASGPGPTWFWQQAPRLSCRHR